jgi:GTP cyclohydrolase I
MVNQNRIKQAMVSIIEAIGEDPLRESIRDTPQRVAEMYAELFCGLDADPKAELTVDFEEGYEEMVILRDIPFYSMCDIPSPGGRVVGVSKLARVVEICARRPQLQERMTQQIADAIFEALQPAGVAVVIQAEHLCMVMRGIKKPGTTVITSSVRGNFRSKVATRSEFLSLIQGK